MTTKEIVDILLVDDTPENLFASEAILENPDYNLIKASSGEEALKYLLKNEVAVILLDVMMPGLDGFQTASTIKTRESSKEIPIIFVTGVELELKKIFQGYSIGAVDYLLKPLDPDVLRAKVAVFADIYRKKQQLERYALERDRASEELKKAHEELEMRIEERTVELKNANELLKLSTISRQLVGQILRDLQVEAEISGESMFRAGQKMAFRIKGEKIQVFLDSFCDMSLGNIVLVEADKTRKRWSFSGDKLVESEAVSNQPNDHYTLGYLCGAITHILKGPRVAGVEVACQSMGDEFCKFVIQVVKN